MLMTIAGKLLATELHKTRKEEQIIHKNGVLSNKNNPLGNISHLLCCLV